MITDEYRFVAGGAAACMYKKIGKGWHDDD